MRLVDADAYSAEMKERQEAAWKWRNEAIAEEDEVKLARAEGAYTAFTEAKLTMDKHVINPWHSMEDNGPPEEKGPYFVYAPSYRGGSSSEKERARGVMISKWTGKHWSIEVGYYKRPGCVTHWMPIEPPEEDA